MPKMLRSTMHRVVHRLFFKCPNGDVMHYYETEWVETRRILDEYICINSSNEGVVSIGMLFKMGDTALNMRKVLYTNTTSKIDDRNKCCKMQSIHYLMERTKTWDV